MTFERTTKTYAGEERPAIRWAPDGKTYLVPADGNEDQAVDKAAQWALDNGVSQAEVDAALDAWLGVEDGHAETEPAPAPVPAPAEVDDESPAGTILAEDLRARVLAATTAPAAPSELDDDTAGMDAEDEASAERTAYDRARRAMRSTGVLRSGQTAAAPAEREVYPWGRFDGTGAFVDDESGEGDEL